jgi:N-acetylneuraminic acid mutarotase
MKKTLLSRSATRLLTAVDLRRTAYVGGLLLTSLGTYAQKAPAVAATQSPGGMLAPGTRVQPTPSARAISTRALTATPVPQALAISTWANAAPLSQARSQHAAVAVGSNIYTWGGYTGSASASTELSSLEIYDAATNTWRTGASVPIVMRGQASAVATDGRVYSFGGFSTTQGAISATYRYTPATNTWTAAAAMPIGQWEAGAATGNDGKIYVLGGQSSNTANQVYNPTTNTWASAAAMPTGRFAEVVVKDAAGLIHAIGGLSNFTGPLVTTHEVYNPATNTWATAAALPMGLNQAGGTLGPDGNIYVVGGKADYLNNNAPFYNTVYVYSPSTNSWSQDTSLPMVLGETQAVTVNGAIYAVAGTNGTQQNVVYRTDLLCQAPVLTLPANQTVAATTGQCSANVAFAASATNQATLRYAIGTTPITSPYTFPVGTTTVTVTATNSCGTATGSFTVTVQDRQAPTILAAGLQAGLINGTRTLEAADIDYGSYDNCGSIASMSISPRTFTCANVGPNQVTLTVTDNAGNSASQTVTVIVVDNTAPVVLAAGLQVNLINGTRTIEAADIDYGSYDECGSITSLTLDRTTFTCANVGPNQVTLTVTDNAGNKASKTVTVVVVDNTAPVLRAAGFTAQLQNGTRTIEAADIDYGSYDECGSLASISISPRTFTCANVGPNQVTITATDKAGNVSSQMVTVFITADATCPPAVTASQGNTLEAYPNPAQAQTRLRFTAQQTGTAQLHVYNTMGELVATLYDGVAEQGQVYERTLGDTRLPAGLYTCRFTQQGQTVIQRVVLTN